MHNLGIKFKKKDIQAALNHPSNPLRSGSTSFTSSLGLSSDYIIVGLLFFKPEIRGKVQKELAIDILFYRTGRGGYFESIRISGDRTIAKSFLAGPNISYLLEDYSGSISLMDYEFWTSEIDFVLFNTYMMQAILPGASEVIISGAQINYGVGITDYRNASTRSTLQGTLKAESSRSGNSDKYVPNTVVGLPCPRAWGRSDIRRLSNYIYPIINIEGLENIRLGKVRKAFRKFVKNFNPEIESPNNEQSFKQ